MKTNRSPGERRGVCYLCLSFARSLYTRHDPETGTTATLRGVLLCVTSNIVVSVRGQWFRASYNIESEGPGEDRGATCPRCQKTATPVYAQDHRTWRFFGVAVCEYCRWLFDVRTREGFDLPRSVAHLVPARPVVRPPPETKLDPTIVVDPPVPSAEPEPAVQVSTPAPTPSVPNRSPYSEVPPIEVSPQIKVTPNADGGWTILAGDAAFEIPSADRPKLEADVIEIQPERKLVGSVEGALEVLLLRHIAPGPPTAEAIRDAIQLLSHLHF